MSHHWFFIANQACTALGFRRGKALVPPPVGTEETGRGILPWRRLDPPTQQTARRGPYIKQGQPRNVRPAPSTQEPHPQPQGPLCCTRRVSRDCTGRKSSMLIPRPPPMDGRGWVGGGTKCTRLACHSRSCGHSPPEESGLYFYICVYSPPM